MEADVARLVERAAAGGPPGAAPRLARLRAAVGDDVFLRDLPEWRAAAGLPGALPANLDRDRTALRERLRRAK